jgi:hypothetical protein
MSSNKKIIIVTSNNTPIKIIEKDFDYFISKKRKYKEIREIKEIKNNNNSINTINI